VPGFGRDQGLAVPVWLTVARRVDPPCCLLLLGKNGIYVAPMSAEVLELRGDIDLNEKPKVAAQLEPLIERQITGIVIDLSQVPYVDSSGLAIFIDALQRVQQYGGKLALAGLQENVRLVFQISRLDKVFSIFNDSQSALAAVTVQHQQ
jgi:anti-sigma B factor antagonist